VGIDYHYYFRTQSDSLLAYWDNGAHMMVSGLQSTSTRFVANATDTLQYDEDYRSAGTHWIADYHGTSKATHVAWEKTWVPAYAVAGSITTHWRYAYEYWSGTQHVTGNMEADCVITYNGSRYATVTVNSYTFTLDLQTGILS
jgi:hypothetical protein